MVKEITMARTRTVLFFLIRENKVKQEIEAAGGKSDDQLRT